jgi:hypothetical protein
MKIAAAHARNLPLSELDSNMLPDLQPGTPDVFQERFFSVLERAYACLSAAAQKGGGQ